MGFAYDPSTSIAWLILRGSGQKLDNLRASAQQTATASSPKLNGAEFQAGSETDVEADFRAGFEADVGADSRAQSEVVLCQSVGGQWLSLEGMLRLSDDPNDRVEALTRYRQRYGDGVGDDPTRIIGIMTVRKMYGFVLSADPEVVHELPSSKAE